MNWDASVCGIRSGNLLIIGQPSCGWYIWILDQANSICVWKFEWWKNDIERKRHLGAGHCALSSSHKQASLPRRRKVGEEKEEEGGWKRKKEGGMWMGRDHVLRKVQASNWEIRGDSRDNSSALLQKCTCWWSGCTWSMWRSDFNGWCSRWFRCGAAGCPPRWRLTPVCSYSHLAPALPARASTHHLIQLWLETSLTLLHSI